MDDNGGFNYVSIHVLVLSNDYTHLSTITIHTRHMEVRRACSLTCYYVSMSYYGLQHVENSPNVFNSALTDL